MSTAKEELMEKTANASTSASSSDAKKELMEKTANASTSASRLADMGVGLTSGDEIIAKRKAAAEGLSGLRPFTSSGGTVADKAAALRSTLPEVSEERQSLLDAKKAISEVTSPFKAFSPKKSAFGQNAAVTTAEERAAGLRSVLPMGSAATQATPETSTNAAGRGALPVGGSRTAEVFKTAAEQRRAPAAASTGTTIDAVAGYTPSADEEELAKLKQEPPENDDRSFWRELTDYFGKGIPLSTTADFTTDANGNPVDARSAEARAAEKIAQYETRTNNASDSATGVLSDSFGNQFAANQISSRVSLDASLAYNDYLDDPTEDNLKYAEYLSLVSRAYMAQQSVALNAESGAVASYLSKDFAAYIPQLVDQGVSSIPFVLLGGAIGGSAGVKTGIVAGSGVYSFKIMRGAAFQTLVEMGIDKEVARKAANNEALISALIEMGDTAWDLLTMGGATLIKAVTGELAQTAATSAAKKIFKMFASYGLNIFQEGEEEASQQSISIANAALAEKGDTSFWHLVLEAGKTYLDFWTNKSAMSAEDVAEIEQAQRGGRRLAVIMGLQTLTNNAAATGVTAFNEKKMADTLNGLDAEDAKAAQLDALGQFVSEFVPGSTTFKKAMEMYKAIVDSGEAASTDDFIEVVKIAREEAAKTGRLARRTEAEVQYDETVATHPEATVLGETALTLTTTSSMDAKTAGRQAEIINKIISGKTLSKSERKALQITNPAVQAIISDQIEGIQFTGAAAKDRAGAMRVVDEAIAAAARYKAGQESLKQGTNQVLAAQRQQAALDNSAEMSQNSDVAAASAPTAQAAEPTTNELTTFKGLTATTMGTSNKVTANGTTVTLRAAQGAENASNGKYYVYAQGADGSVVSPLKPFTSLAKAIAHANDLVKKAGGNVNGAETADTAKAAGAGLQSDTGRVGEAGPVSAKPEPVLQKGNGDVRQRAVRLLFPNVKKKISAAGATVLNLQDASGDLESFSQALIAAREANTERGWMVSTKTVGELQSIIDGGGVVLLSADKRAGLAITKDGDVEAAFANKDENHLPKMALWSLLPTAIINGGKKLDCYGIGLVNQYIQFGFVPVARIAFNEEYADPLWDASKGKPDVYFMVHNGDTVDSILKNMPTYKKWTQADLDTLPLITDDLSIRGDYAYEKALNFRDDMLADMSKQKETAKKAFAKKGEAKTTETRAEKAKTQTTETTETAQTTDTADTANIGKDKVTFADGTTVTREQYFASEGDTVDSRALWQNLSDTPAQMLTASTGADFIKEETDEENQQGGSSEDKVEPGLRPVGADVDNAGGGQTSDRRDDGRVSEHDNGEDTRGGSTGGAEVSGVSGALAGQNGSRRSRPAGAKSRVTGRTTDAQLKEDTRTSTYDMGLSEGSETDTVTRIAKKNYDQHEGVVESVDYLRSLGLPDVFVDAFVHVFTGAPTLANGVTFDGASTRYGLWLQADAPHYGRLPSAIAERVSKAQATLNKLETDWSSVPSDQVEELGDLWRLGKNEKGQPNDPEYYSSFVRTLLKVAKHESGHMFYALHSTANGEEATRKLVHEFLIQAFASSKTVYNALDNGEAAGNASGRAWMRKAFGETKYTTAFEKYRDQYYSTYGSLCDGTQEGEAAFAARVEEEMFCDALAQLSDYGVDMREANRYFEEAFPNFAGDFKQLFDNRVQFFGALRLSASPDSIYSKTMEERYAAALADPDGFFNDMAHGYPQGPLASIVNWKLPYFQSSGHVVSVVAQGKSESVKSPHGVPVEVQAHLAELLADPVMVFETSDPDPKTGEERLRIGVIVDSVGYNYDNNGNVDEPGGLFPLVVFMQGGEARVVPPGSKKRIRMAANVIYTDFYSPKVGGVVADYVADPDNMSPGRRVLFVNADKLNAMAKTLKWTKKVDLLPWSGSKFTVSQESLKNTTYRSLDVDKFPVQVVDDTAFSFGGKRAETDYDFEQRGPQLQREYRHNKYLADAKQYSVYGALQVALDNMAPNRYFRSAKQLSTELQNYGATQNEIEGSGVLSGFTDVMTRDMLQAKVDRAIRASMYPAYGSLFEALHELDPEATYPSAAALLSALREHGASEFDLMESGLIAADNTENGAKPMTVVAAREFVNTAAMAKTMTAGFVHGPAANQGITIALTSLFPDTASLSTVTGLLRARGVTAEALRWSGVSQMADPESRLSVKDVQLFLSQPVDGLETEDVFLPDGKLALLVKGGASSIASLKSYLRYAAYEGYEAFAWEDTSIDFPDGYLGQWGTRAKVTDTEDNGRLNTVDIPQEMRKDAVYSTDKVRLSLTPGKNHNSYGDELSPQMAEYMQDSVMRTGTTGKIMSTDTPLMPMYRGLETYHAYSTDKHWSFWTDRPEVANTYIMSAFGGGSQLFGLTDENTRRIMNDLIAQYENAGTAAELAQAEKDILDLARQTQKDNKDIRRPAADKKAIAVGPQPLFTSDAIKYLLDSGRADDIQTITGDEFLENVRALMDTIQQRAREWYLGWPDLYSQIHAQATQRLSADRLGNLEYGADALENTLNELVGADIANADAAGLYHAVVTMFELTRFATASSFNTPLLKGSSIQQYLRYADLRGKITDMAGKGGGRWQRLAEDILTARDSKTLYAAAKGSITWVYSKKTILEDAQSIWRDEEKGLVMLETYLNLTHPYVLDCHGASFDSLTSPFGGVTDTIVRNAFNDGGYDGVIFLNILDDVSGGDTVPGSALSTVAVTFEPNQAKSTANRHPTDDPDMRYSKTPKADAFEQGTVAHDIASIMDNSTSVDEAVKRIEQWVNGITNTDNMTEEDKELLGRIFANPLTKLEIRANENAIKKLVKEYGAIPPGEKAARKVKLPTQTDDDMRVRQFLRSAAEAKAMPKGSVPYIKDMVLHDELATYARVTDVAARNYADREINRRGYQALLREWDGLASSSHVPTKNDIAVGELLAIEAAKVGDMDTAMRVIADVAAMGTTAGQVVQAMHMIKRMSPGGQIYYLQKSIERLNADAAKRGQPEIIMDKDLVKAVLKAKTPEDAQIAMDALLDDIAARLPVTVADKWNAWRYLSMLGNARTHIRNLFGNAIFMPLTFAKNVLATGMETAFLPDEQRTKGFGASQAMKDFATADFELMADELTNSGKYNPADILRDRRVIFKSKAFDWVNKASKFNLGMLEAEDRIFLKKHYITALSGYLAARGADPATLRSTTDGKKTLNAARSYAMQEALKATYRDFSAAATALNRLKRVKGFGWFVDGIIPFTKTPLNILKRGVEYSPAGLIKAITFDIAKLKTGQITGAEYIDRLAAGMTGTMVSALGWLMSSLGLVKGGDDDDDKKALLDEARGFQNYSITIGNVNYTIDWMVPIALPFFVGVEFQRMLADGGFEFKDAVDALMLLAEPMFSLSMLDGLNRTLKSAGYSDNPLSAVLSTALLSYVGQGMASLGGQIARTIDPDRRATYTDKNSALPAAVDRWLQSSVEAKIPGLASERMAYRDVWGRTDTTDSFVLRAFENLLSPGYISITQTSAMEDELLRLYEATGNENVMPGEAAKYFTVDNVRLDLSADQYEQLVEIRGQTAYNMLTELTGGAAYASLTDAQKAKAVKDVYDYASQLASQAVAPDYNTDRWVGQIQALSGVDKTEAIVARTLVGTDESGDTTTVSAVVGMDWLTDDDRGNLIASTYYSDRNVTDPRRSGYEYVLTEANQTREVQIYNELFDTAYAKLLDSYKWKRAETDEEMAELLNEMMSEVRAETRKQLAGELRQAGVSSTEK